MSASTIALCAVASLRIEVGPPIMLGELDGLERRLVPILGGTVAGPHFSGVVLPGGNDVQTVQANGTIRLVARYALDLGSLGKVMVENAGIRHMPAASTVETAPYFRGVMHFQAPAGSLAWLNQALFITSGQREGGIVQLEVAQVL